MPPLPCLAAHIANRAREEPGLVGSLVAHAQRVGCARSCRQPHDATDLPEQRFLRSRNTRFRLDGERLSHRREVRAGQDSAPEHGRELRQ